MLYRMYVDHIKSLFDNGESPYFKRQEFASKGPNEQDTWTCMNYAHVILINALRGELGRPMTINSAYRTPTHNARVGGAPSSQHLRGRASDISTKGWSTEDKIKLVIHARRMGFKGIGVHRDFVHIDNRLSAAAAWIYPHGGGQENIPVGEEAKYV